MSDLFGPGDQPGPAAPSSRAALRNNPALRRRKRQRRVRAAVVILVTAAIVVGAGFFVVGPIKTLFGDKEQEITDYPGPGQGEVEVKIAQGASGAAIGQALVESGVIKSQKVFTQAITAYTESYGAPNLQYGTYSLKKEMAASDALLAMLDTANRVQNGVTVREGLNTEETLARLASVTAISPEDFEEASKNTEALGLPAEADGDLEGWLAPATYPYTDDTTAEELLSRMIAKQISDLDELDVDPADRMTVLIKASLVEKEAPAEARAKVAQVIENRLAVDMALQFDSTVHFLVGGSADASTTAEQRETDSPYNTYKYPGLPPGPIANPGKAAVEAALNPEPGDWLFFVTVNPETGETKFAVTHDEHLENKKEYEQYLRDHAKSAAENSDDE